MKKLALIAALSVVGIANAQAADGTITINGLVTDKTCTINTPAGKDFTVTLPTVSRQTLANAGEGKDQVLFAKLGLTAEKPKPTVAELSIDAMSA